MGDSFSGVWRSPNNYSPFDRRWFGGTTTDLLTYDGGNTTFGAMWVVDPAAVGRATMSPGLVPGSDPPKTLAQGESYGAGSHVISDAEGAVGQHTHGFGKYLSGAAGLASTGNFTVPTYSGSVVQGIGGGSAGSDTTANLFTLPAGNTAAGVVGVAMSLVPPVIGYYLIMPSGRTFYNA